MSKMEPARIFRRELQYHELKLDEPEKDNAPRKVKVERTPEEWKELVKKAHLNEGGIISQLWG